MGKGRKIAFLGLMLGLVIVLSIAESLLPPMAFLPPGVKPGLSHIFMMYCLFFVGAKEAFGLAVLKSLFALLTRGMVAAFLSLTGGWLSLAVIFLLVKVFGNRISYLALGVAGAVTHNLGQLAASSVLIGSAYVFFYLPAMLVSGVVMGCVTGTLLKVVMPYMHSMHVGKKPGGSVHLP